MLSMCISTEFGRTIDAHIASWIYSWIFWGVTGKAAATPDKENDISGGFSKNSLMPEITGFRGTKPIRHTQRRPWTDKSDTAARSGPRAKQMSMEDPG
mmetsp:Transcript_16854/g.32501  ORF Transcript_16854/g.32501 Transcript_16854/m.32501 type:complete len:98 (+) Transcript_16854:94-387(+)